MNNDETQHALRCILAYADAIDNVAGWDQDYPLVSARRLKQTLNGNTDIQDCDIEAAVAIIERADRITTGRHIHADAFRDLGQQLLLAIAGPPYTANEEYHPTFSNESAFSLNQYGEHVVSNIFLAENTPSQKPLLLTDPVSPVVRGFAPHPDRK